MTDGYEDRPPSGTPPTEEPTEADRSMGELVLDLSDRITVLVREEIELAKAEVSEKVDKLVKGSVVGIAAALFVVGGLAMLMHGIAWLLSDLVFGDTVWLGFFTEALFWFLVAAGAGYWAYRSFQAGAPPTPDLAIEEAKRTRDAFEEAVEGFAADARGDDPAAAATPAAGATSAAAPTPTTGPTAPADSTPPTGSDGDDGKPA